MPNLLSVEVVKTQTVRLACAVAFFSVALATAPAAFAVHDLDNIEMDGNTVNDGLADDWDDIYLGTNSALRAFFADDTAETDNSVFKGGMKDTIPVSQWTCVDTIPQNKNNIQLTVRTLLSYYGKHPF